MKRFFCLLLLVAMATGSFTEAAPAADIEDCATKEARILAQIASPKHATDRREIQILQRELEMHRAQCSDEQQKIRLEAHIAKCRNRLVELQLHLDNTRTHGSLQEVLALEEKLQETYIELESARTKWANLQ